jgi:hypothetical protein
VYADFIARQKPSEDSAWLGILDICYADAIISWNQLFGTRSQETHWSKFVSRIPIPEGERLIPFTKELIIKNLKITEKQWEEFHQQMLTFRNIRLAHFNIVEITKGFPEMKLMVEACGFYREWLIQALKMGKRLGYHGADITDEKLKDVIESFSSAIRKSYFCEK